MEKFEVGKTYESNKKYTVVERTDETVTFAYMVDTEYYTTMMKKTYAIKNEWDSEYVVLDYWNYFDNTFYKVWPEDIVY